jgi:hypothetical protein
MGKVTIKHYLNTKVQPEKINNENYYPVYIQITINRKTTQYKSISLAKFTEIEFSNYIQGKDYKADFVGMGVAQKGYFEKEPERIKQAFEYMIEHYSSDKIDKDSIKNMWAWVSGHFLMWTKTQLIEQCWDYKINTEKKNKFYKPFNKENTLTENIEIINKEFGADISNKFESEDLEFWNNVRLLIKRLGKNSIYIDFLGNYKNEIGKIKNITNKEKFIKEIEEITGITKYYKVVENWSVEDLK